MNRPSRELAHGVRVLFEDDALMVVSKPSGMLVHRGWGDAEVVLVDVMRQVVAGDKVHTIHRLDRGTSGAVIFAQTPEDARALNDMFDAGEVTKRYLTLVRGIAPESGDIDHPIPNKPRGKKRVPAQSSFRRLAALRDTEPRELSLVEVMPHTGRVHQIRRHMRHINHHLIGDTTYGKGKLNRAIRDRYGLDRLALHALSLEFPHPRTGEPVRVVDPLPEDFVEALERMGVEWDHTVSPSIRARFWSCEGQGK